MVKGTFVKVIRYNERKLIFKYVRGVLTWALNAMKNLKFPIIYIIQWLIFLDNTITSEKHVCAFNCTYCIDIRENNYIFL